MVLYAKTVSLLIQCCRVGDDAIGTCKKGVDFMENRAEWHHKVPSDEQFQEALKQIGAK